MITVTLLTNQCTDDVTVIINNECLTWNPLPPLLLIFLFLVLVRVGAWGLQRLQRRLEWQTSEAGDSGQ